MKIEPGKKYRVKTKENSVGIKFHASVGEDVVAIRPGPYHVECYLFSTPLSGEQSIPIECIEGFDVIQPIAENLWQTLCYVKQALDSGQEIDKEYIAKVLAENRPEENYNPHQ